MSATQSQRCENRFIFNRPVLHKKIENINFQRISVIEFNGFIEASY